MSTKKQFLGELRGLLHKAPSGEVNDLIEYYDELISERVAGGEKESKVIKNLDTPKDISATFKRDIAINRAAERPTLSNGIKVLIAILGVLSLPILLPVLGAIVAAAATIIAVLVTCFVVSIALIVGAILSVVDMAMVVHAGDAPFYLLFLVLGGALIVIALMFEAMRGLMKLIRLGIRSFIGWIKTRHDHKHNKKQEAK